MLIVILEKTNSVVRNAKTVEININGVRREKCFQREVKLCTKHPVDVETGKQNLLGHKSWNFLIGQIFLYIYI